MSRSFLKIIDLEGLINAQTWFSDSKQAEN